MERISEIEEDARFTIIGEGKRQFSSESFINIFVQHDIHHLHKYMQN